MVRLSVKTSAMVVSQCSVNPLSEVLSASVFTDGGSLNRPQYIILNAAGTFACIRN